MSDENWEEFSRRRLNHSSGFYACVDGEGVWFDSANDLATAVHWCAYACGKFGLSTEEELRWFDSVPKERRMSIVHSDTLRKMWEAGLIT
jgi:hypothetical protein